MEQLEQLRTAYNKACNDYLNQLLETWELDGHYGYWIADEVGGLYDYAGSFTINMDEIIYCVENNVTQEQFVEWQEYICDASEFGFPMPNIKSWMHGCPRTSQETFKKLRTIKNELKAAVDEEKKRQQDINAPTKTVGRF
jgi:hypothetical protein